MSKMIPGYSKEDMDAAARGLSHHLRCGKCEKSLPKDQYPRTKNPFIPEGRVPVCFECLEEGMRAKDYAWAPFDKLCQRIDMPFEVNRFQELVDDEQGDVVKRYFVLMETEPYQNLEWGDLYNRFKEAVEANEIDDEVAVLRVDRYRKLKKKWGMDYAEEELRYLEGLFDGINTTQNVSGALQQDQVIKLCKISLEMDSRIREGAEFDKLMSSYDKLVKTSGLTPKNVKNSTDFESLGEFFHWLEKRGWRNHYYTDAPRDIVDSTIENIQNYNRRLYTNENGIGEEITNRIEALKAINDMEDVYDIEDAMDADRYENEGYVGLWQEEEEDFSDDMGEGSKW